MPCCLASANATSNSWALLTLRKVSSLLLVDAPLMVAENCKGRKGFDWPLAAPTNNNTPHTNNPTPKPFQKRGQPAWVLSKAPIKIPHTINNKPHNTKVTAPAKKRDNNQIATINNNTPNTDFTATIHEPALGNKLPPPRPINNNGVPIPKPKANNAAPPNHISPVLLMYNNAPAKGADTHGETTKADKAPINNTPK